MVRAISVVPIQPVLDGAVRRHVVWRLEAEREADVLARHGHLLDDYLVLKHRKYSKPKTTSISIAIRMHNE